MYSLTIAVGPTMWSLLFTSEDNAKKQEAALTTGLHTNSALTGLKDDFGQMLQVVASSVHSWVLEDMDATKLAHCECMLHQARVQGTAQRMAESDPMLRMGQNIRGPGIISAVPGNGR